MFRKANSIKQGRTKPGRKVTIGEMVKLINSTVVGKVASSFDVTKLI